MQMLYTMKKITLMPEIMLEIYYLLTLKKKKLFQVILDLGGIKEV